MSWRESIGSVLKDAFGRAAGQCKSPATTTSGSSNFTIALDPIPPGSRIKPRKWSRIRALHKQADELESTGQVMEARAYSVKALNLAMKLGGREDPGLGACFYHFAKCVENSGDFTGAEQNYNAAFGILKATEGDATLLKAEVLLSYGLLYLNMGLGWRALLMLGWAKSRFDELFGPDDGNVGRVLMGIGTSYEIEGVEDQAIATYDEAIRILSHAWEPTHPMVNITRWARADLAFWRAIKAGDRAGVEQELAELRVVLRQREEATGHEDPAANAHLGVSLIVSGELEEGASLLANAIQILEAVGQPVASYRRQLASARAQQGNTTEALTLVRRAFLEDPPLGDRLAHGSERERGEALEQANAHLERFLDLVLLTGSDDPLVVAEACDLVLSRKALGAELLFLQRQAVSSADDPELRPLMNRLAELRARQAESSLVGEEYDAELGAEIERTEWELASRVPAMDAQAITMFTHTSVGQRLPPASVLIEFVRFTRQVVVPEGTKDSEEASYQWYVAFVIRSGEGEGVQLVDLGAAADIDRFIHEYRASLKRADVSLETGVRLRELLFDPLRPAIGDRTRVLIAPDGDVSWVPFDALPDAPSRYLIDTLDISYLSVGRDLERLASHKPPDRSGAPLVMADPDYDLPRNRRSKPEGALSTTNGGEPEAISSRDRVQLRDELNRGEIIFQRLPGTRTEGLAIASLLQVEPLLGEAASEKRLKAVRSPLVLHVATHGFFLPGHAPKVSARRDLKTAAARNPLVRSGIVLSGVNAWLRGDSPPDYIDDGIVNGEDVVAMDLTVTEMVVLSACQTGLGDLVAGEGAIGLRRAFMVAGARTLVLSLWSVPDEQTQMLMTYFYEGLLNGKGRAASLRDGQQRVRAMYPEPYYWAAFICLGDPEPIGQLNAPAARQ